MHVFGHPSDLDRIMKVARDYNLQVVEDAAESLGSYFNARHTGRFGLLGALSFNGNKTITTGGGGAIITDDSDLARKAKHLVTTSKLPHQWRYEHDEIGFNYRMPNLNAALGCAQLEALPEQLTNKRALFQRYCDAFAPIGGVSIFAEPPGAKSNYWLQTLILDADLSNELESVLAASNGAGLMTRPIWTLLNNLTPYEHCPKMDLSTSTSLGRRILSLPSSTYSPDFYIE